MSFHSITEGVRQEELQGMDPSGQKVLRAARKQINNYKQEETSLATD